jgi:hypothetical protein
MKVLREVGGVQLNEGNLMAKGLNNLYNEKTGEVSLWFDDELKNSLMEFSDDEFIFSAKLYFQIAEIE